jgi:ferrous iron transport protein A
MDSCRAWHQSDVIQSLAQLHKGARGVVSSVAAFNAVAASSTDAACTDCVGSSVERRLMELGFIPGEHIEVIEEVRPGGDPIAVRIGSSIFALRRREAQAVMVTLEQP